MLRVTLAAAALAAASSAQANIQITEWMYNGNGPTGEYVEITNLGTTAVDFTGWSFDDSSRTPGSMSLSGLGLLAPGASAILAEADATLFRSTWNLGANVAVVGGNTNNLGRADEINLYDAAGALVDQLTYGDAVFPGTVRTQNFSGNPGSLADLAPSVVTTGWVLSAVGDAYGSYASALGDVGNPGVFAPVPEPGTWALLLAGVGIVAGVARRRGL
jgi:predicted extracellular nuclease